MSSYFSPTFTLLKTQLLALLLLSFSGLATNSPEKIGDAKHKVVSGLAVADYTITTTGGIVTITDVSGNGETLTVSQSGSNIRFNVTGKTYQIDAGAITPFTTPADVDLTGKTSITINTAVGNDIIDVGAFNTNLPSLTVNGGTGDDAVNFNGDITFTANANLDVDLQNDDITTPGIDAVTITGNANLLLSGTGSATVKVSKNVTVNAGGSLETFNGNLTVEANRQATPTNETFIGVDNVGLLQVTGSGTVSIKGTGGTGSGLQYGVRVANGGDIIGGTNGTVTVEGTGGAGTGFANYGVYLFFTGTTITSTGGNVSVTGQGGGVSGALGNNYGVILSGGTISAGGNGTVTVYGTGAVLPTGNNNHGVSIPSGTITSSGGNVTVTGYGGGSGAAIGNFGVSVSGTISAGGSGTVTVQGTGSSTSTTFGSNGVSLGSGGLITSSGGNVSVTGLGGGLDTGNGDGVTVQTSGIITAGANGTVTVQGTGGGTTASTTSSMGVFVSFDGTITSNGGNVNVSGQGGMALNTVPFCIGVDLNDGIITAGGNGNVNVQGTGGPNGGSNHGVYAATSTSGITSSGGNVSVTGQAGGTGSNTSCMGIELRTNGYISAGGNGTVTLHGAGGASAGHPSYGINCLSGLITSGGGNISVTGLKGVAGNSVGINLSNSNGITTSANGGNITLIANRVSLSAAISTNAAGSTTLHPYTNGLAINLGSNSSGLTLYDADLDYISTGTLIIGDANSGAITVSADITRSAATDVELISGGDVILSGGGFNTGGGTLFLDPGTTPAAVKPTFNGTDVTASTLSFGSDLALAINGTTPGTQYDQLTVAGSINLSGVMLKVSGSHTPVAGQTFTIIDNDGSEAVTGTFTGLAQGATISNFLGSALNATISYTGGTGNDVVITVASSALPDLTITKATSSTFIQGGTAIYNLTVNNIGTANSSGTYTITDPLPSGLTVQSVITGAAWNCTSSTSTQVNCISTTAISSGSSAGVVQVIVNIAGNAPSGITNTASVSGGGETNTANNTSSVTSTVNALPNYTLTTTGNIITLTDVSGNGETLTVSENAGNINFNVTGRTYSLDGGPATNFPADISLSGKTGIVLNTANGADIINIGAFTANLPSLTINGGTGNDAVNFNGTITFANNANLDVDLQNDDVNPGVDAVTIAANANLLLSGTGTATLKVSKNVTVNASGSLQTVNGNLTVEANQQAAPTAGDFKGVRVTGTGGLLQSTGSGLVSIKGKGGDDAVGGQFGVWIESGGKISGGTGSLTVTGNGGIASGNSNIGVVVQTANAVITSSGGNVTVTGTGGGVGASSDNYGVFVSSNSQITAGGTGTVTITGNGGSSSGADNFGLYALSANSLITSSGGNVSVTGKEGSGSSGIGSKILGGVITTATNGGNLTLIANSMELSSSPVISTNAAGTLTLRPFTNNTAINLGSATDPIGGPLSLSDAELDRMTTGTLIIGDANSNTITVSANITRPTATNVQLISAGDVSLSGGGFNTNGGTLFLDPGTTPAAVKPTFNGTDVTASTLSFGSDLAILINGTTPGTQYDQLKVVGSIDLTGVSLMLSGAPALGGGETFIIVDNDGSEAITGTFTGLAQGATISNFLGSGLNATISYTGGTNNDVVITVATPAPADYTITTTGNTIVITDVSGNGETLTVSENGGNIRFNVPGRTYQIDAGSITPFTTPADVALSGKNSITINTANGADIINIGAFTANLPSLTVNGGTGDDAVNFNGNITFANNTNLDLDLQNDDTTPGIDAVTIATNANLLLSGTGAATVKVSKNVTVNAGGSLQTVNGNLVVEANQQATPTTGNLVGVVLNGTGSLFRSTGSGSVTIKGKSGDAASGYQYGIYISGGQISSGTGPLTVTGEGGISEGNFNIGIYVNSTGSLITSSGGNVNVTGTGGGSGVSVGNFGVYVYSGGQIMAGGSGTTTVTGQGGTTATGGTALGVWVVGSNSVITSLNGNVTVTGTGGGLGTGIQNKGISVESSGQISAGGNGTLTLTGTGGTSSGVENYGVHILGSTITSGGGAISITGKEGSGATGYGIRMGVSTINAATNGGNITLIANSINISNSSSISTNTAGTLTIRAFTTNTAINLGSATDPIGGPLSLSDAELDFVSAGTLVIGDVNSGPITVSSNITRPTATNVQLISSGDVTLSGGGFNTNGGTLFLDPGTTPAAVKPIFNGTDVTASTLTFGSDLAIAINGTTPGTQYDQLKVVGSIDLNGVTLKLSGTPSPVLAGGETFTIVDNDGSDLITGTFTGLSQGATLSNFPGSGLTATISYTGGTGNDVVISVNPLPTAVVSGGGTVCSGDALPNVTITLTGTPPWAIAYSNGTTPTSVPVINSSPYVIVGAGPGTYTVTAVSNADGNGVSMTGSAIVSVTPKPADIVTNATICSGESYVWAANGQTYTTNQTALTITNNGCTANQVLNLTVTPKPAPVVTNATICSGESYTWAANGQSYTTNQTGLTITNNGCTANQVLNLTVNPAPSATISYSGSPFCTTSDAVSVTRTGTPGGTYSVSPSGLTLNTMTGQITPNSSPTGTYTVTYTIEAAGGCPLFTTSTTVSITAKPTIILNVLGQTLNEGNSQTLCDTDANPVNGLQFPVSGSCVVGLPVWRVQVGNGAWSDWSATAPSSQPSNNTAYHYQAACNANCPSTYTNPIILTINYRASSPQNVSLTADGTTVTEGQSATICNLEGNVLTFNATCANGEILLYSVDGSDYSTTLSSQIVDNMFHNYRVRCRKGDGTISCVETESAVMSLKITTSGPAPTVSITPTTGCGTPTSFSGTSTCGALTTIWYNAANNQALPTLPTQTPNATTSYYARCQNTASAGEAGCLSEPSNTVTFTITPVNDPPTITASADIVCTGTQVTISANCPVGSTAFWNTGVTTNSFQVAFSNVTKQTYWAKCIFPNGCQSPESGHETIFWKAFELTFINIGQSQSATKPANDRNLWTGQFITPDAGPALENSTEANPTLYFTENPNKGGPRFWTIQVETCNLGTDGSVTYDMLAMPEVGTIRSYNTHENNAPYLMYANREGWTELYAQNHPAYGFYQDNGSGGNTYDAGLPKGLYKLGIRYWDQKGQGSIYPSTRQPAGNVLAYQEYWFRIQSQNGVGAGAARIAKENGEWKTENGAFTQIMPNPVTNTLHLKVNQAKGQKVNISLVDASGRALLQRAFLPETDQHQEEFEVSHLANGMYFLQVKTANQQTTLKVIKVQ